MFRCYISVENYIYDNKYVNSLLYFHFAVFSCVVSQAAVISTKPLVYIQSEDR